MMRSRLFWFTAGFGVPVVVISQVVWMDILRHRYRVLNQMNANFFDLERRVQNLESLTNPLGVED